MDKKKINKKIYFAVIIIMAVLAFLNINANASTIQTKDIENISNKAYEQFKKGIETNTIIENNNKTLKVMSASGDNEYRYYRGSFLAWSRDHIRYQFSGGRIRGSWGWQETGAVWPNEVQKSGIYRVGPRGGWSERWAGNKSLIGHHPITGGVLFKTDWIDYFRINANGKAWKE